MALLERVSTLVRANLNDLIDKAEHPEKMIKQVIIDMQSTRSKMIWPALLSNAWRVTAI